MSKKSKKLSVGAIAGISVASVLIAGTAIGLGVYFGLPRYGCGSNGKCEKWKTGKKYFSKSCDGKCGGAAPVYGCDVVSKKCLPWTSGKKYASATCDNACGTPIVPKFGCDPQDNRCKPWQDGKKFTQETDDCASITCKSPQATFSCLNVG